MLILFSGNYFYFQELSLNENTRHSLHLNSNDVLALRSLAVSIIEVLLGKNINI